MATVTERSIVETITGVWDAIEEFRADVEQKELYLKVGNHIIRQGTITVVIDPAKDSAGRSCLMVDLREDALRFYDEEAEALRWYFKQTSLDLMEAYREAQQAATEKSQEEGGADENK